MKIVTGPEWKRILFVIIPYFFSVGILQLIAASLTGLDYSNYDNQHATSFQLFILDFSGLSGTLFVLYVLIRFRYKEKFKDIGFQYFSLKDVYLGLILGIIIMSFGFSILLLNNQIKILSIDFNFTKLLLSLFSFVFVAFSEEIFCRGYILGNLLKCMNKYLALIISAILFTLMHAANPNMNIIPYINLFLVGLVLGAAYLYTKNLWFSIALHFSWNFFQGTIFGFDVSGMNGYSLIIQERFANNIFNGGSFGFEGSVIVIVLQLIIIPLIYYYYKKKNNSLLLQTQ